MVQNSIVVFEISCSVNSEFSCIGAPEILDFYKITFIILVISAIGNLYGAEIISKSGYVIGVYGIEVICTIISFLGLRQKCLVNSFKLLIDRERISGSVYAFL